MVHKFFANTMEFPSQRNVSFDSSQRAIKINHEGTRMVEDGKHLLGLQKTNLKNLG